MMTCRTSIRASEMARASRVALGATLALASTPALAQNFINVGTSSSASSQYTYWVSVGQSIEAGTGGTVIPTIMETGASVDNLRRMSRGEIELGLATAEAAGQAYRAIGAFEGEDAMSDLRMLWCYAALPNIYVTRADAGIGNLTDLEGKPYNVGIPGSSTEAQTRTVFETLGITPRHPDERHGGCSRFIAGRPDRGLHQGREQRECRRRLLHGGEHHTGREDRRNGL